ncbi:MAG: L-histidine N(alpha)-methyltransferase, partial [Spongiibacteraceae bacterium]
AIFNPAESRIEMHLRSLRSQKISVAGRTFQFAANETIHTENSYKYAVADFTAMAERAGFFAEALWLDESSFFSVHYMAVK